MEEDECMICLEPLNSDVAVLSCGHRYHYSCIKLWSNKIKNYTKLCSVCDKDVEIINIINNKQKNYQDTKLKSNKVYPLDKNDSNKIVNNQRQNNQQRYSFCNIM